jgi:DMSO/TMAO reductase YedYZ molybdopterin-dependent catalytic subunit
MSRLRTHDVPDGVEPSDWRLRVTGAVDRPLDLDPDEITALPTETITEDFECLDGWTAEDCSWRGVRIGSLFGLAEPTVEEGYVLVHAMDGDYACSLSIERAVDALLAVGLDGGSLPVEHGGPARLVPTGEGADCWESVKWVSALEIRAEDPVDDDTAKTIAIGRLGDDDR